MAELPDEIWTDVLDYLEPRDVVSTQLVSSRLLTVARDSRLWRFKCYETAPSAARSLSDRSGALSALTGALGGLSLNDRAPPPAQATSPHAVQQLQQDKRAKAVAEWDCTDPAEQLDWYSEYIARHAPLSVDWADQSVKSAEVRGMALFNNESRVVGPVDDGSLRVWSVEQSEPQQRHHLKQVSTSKAGILFQDLSASPESSGGKARSLGHAVDNVVVDSFRNRAYVSAECMLNEVDLDNLTVVSQHQYAWPVTALSQTSEDQEFSLTVGTSWSLHIHDPRIPLHSPTSPNDNTSKVDLKTSDPTIAFLPNYSKLDVRDEITSSREAADSAEYFSSALRGGIQAYARVEPGPQSILHRGLSEIIIAGRMPSILFYDRRFFPRLKSSIHSGARLSSITTIPFPPINDTDAGKDAHTLIACGEYGGCGSLEIYGLSATSDLDEHDVTTSSMSTAEAYQQLMQRSSSPLAGQSGYSFKNRQSASSSKLLSVCVQGARILFSDAQGQLKWVERDGRGIARRWDINAASYGFSVNKNNSIGRNLSAIPINAGITLSSDVVRKMIPMTRRANNANESQTTRGDSDILVWTGEKIGIVTYKQHSDGADCLNNVEEAFNSSGIDSGSEDEERGREEEYSRQMRRALERQADERRWMSRFGGRWR